MRPCRVAARAALWSAAALAAACKGTEPQAATSIAVAPSGPVAFASLNATQQLAASVLDQHGSPMTGVSVTWTSSSPGVATVDATGLVTSKANGAATITAASGGLRKPVAVTVAQVAAALVKTGGDAQSGVGGGPLAQEVAVRLADLAGTPVWGATVSFVATSGGGSVSSASVLTGPAGEASVRWTLGTSGPQELQASAGALTVTFAASLATAAVGAFAGNGQTALVGNPTNVRPAVRIVGAGNTPVPNVQVTFAVTGGGGSATGTTVPTDVDGVAQVGRWTVGALAGANTLVATAAGGGIANNPVTFIATGAAPTFQITVQNIGPAFSPPVQAAFDSAVAFWQRAIYRTVGQSNVSSPAGFCGTGSPAINRTVKDVLILVRIDTIDGPGAVLGMAGPCQVHPVGGLTRLGTMVFDSADINNMVGGGVLNSLIRHEMGHVLGFGTLWVSFDCVQNRSQDGTVLDTYFSCPNARSAFDVIGGASYTGGAVVPVENCGPASPAGCGSGTVNAHWREPTFGTELMTGYLSLGANPASLVTIAAMEDLGYVVNYGAAEAYVHTFTAPSAFRAESGPLLDLHGDIYRGPIYTTDARGRLVRVDRP